MNIWLLHPADLPFIVMVALGIFLPEVYLLLRLSYKPLVTLRLATLFVSCTLATIINHLPYPQADPGTTFTRAFIFIAFTRIVMITSHWMAAQKPPPEPTPQDAHKTAPLEEIQS